MACQVTHCYCEDFVAGAADFSAQGGWLHCCNQFALERSSLNASGPDCAVSRGWLHL